MIVKLFSNSTQRMVRNFFVNQASSRYLSSTAKMKAKSLDKYETLSLTVPKPFVYHVELNRPDKLNAFNNAMFLELTDCFNSLHKDEDCRVIMLSGAGRLFTAGLDLTSVAMLGEKLAQHDDVARRCKVFRELIIAYQDAITAPEKCVKPVISLVHNGCIGAGTDLITAVDIRYCSEDTYFQVKEVELGMAADIGVLQRLPRVIGSATLANELCLTGRKFPAQEALKAGLVSKVFKDKQSMMASGLELAESLANKSPVAVQMIKRNMLYSRDYGVEAGLRHIADWNQVMLQSEDFMNAAMALATKSPPPTFSKL